MISHAPLIDLPFHGEFNAPKGVDNCDQYPESLPAYFIKEYTKKGHAVYDPFMGFGTTAFVAEKTGRIPYGTEADGERFEWAAGQLEHWQNIIHSDAAQAAKLGFPKMDFCITSPPYMPCHHKWNPLYGGDPKYAGYDTYLKRMGFIFGQIAKIMKRNAYIVVQADNLPGRRYTPLVHDLHTQLAKHFTPQGETIVRWTDPKPDYPHTHCLIFKKTI